jgi:hypothetical protein
MKTPWLIRIRTSYLKELALWTFRGAWGVRCVARAWWLGQTGVELSFIDSEKKKENTTFYLQFFFSRNRHKRRFLLLFTVMHV